jgi:hypothetical protein
MQEVASRKRKRIPGREPRPLEVMDEVEAPREKRTRQTRMQASRQIQRSLSPYSNEPDVEGLAELEDDSIGSCIVVIPCV